MPLKRLISPLLTVCVQSRQVALRHYGTRINMYERPSPMEWTGPTGHESQVGIRVPWGMNCRDFTEARFGAIRRRALTYEAPSSVQSRLIHPLKVTEPVWADRDCVADLINFWLEQGINRDLFNAPVNNCGQVHEKDYEKYEADAAIQNKEAYRGCVYLDLASDRFMLLMNPNHCYGLREVSNALDDLKSSRIAPRSSATPRPPLSDEVLMGIRHVVLPEFSLQYPTVRSYRWTRVGHCLRNPWAICPDPELEEDGLEIAASNHPGIRLLAPRLSDSSAWAMTLPGAFGATPTSTTWGFNTNSEMYRTFFNDIEDKGPEHLRLQKVRKESNGPGPEDWKLVWD
ncbi:hypothetical protein PG987_004728 [Apiospora arundinis]